MPICPPLRLLDRPRLGDQVGLSTWTERAPGAALGGRLDVDDRALVFQYYSDTVFALLIYDVETALQLVYRKTMSYELPSIDSPGGDQVQRFLYVLGAVGLTTDEHSFPAGDDVGIVKLERLIEDSDQQYTPAGPHSGESLVDNLWHAGCYQGNVDPFTIGDLRH